MTIKDWIYLGITIASYLLAIIAGVYAKDKAKINRATKSGQIMDTLGKLATYAVHEAEHTGMENEDKRKYASEVINQGLKWFGITDVTPTLIDGAIEKAVNAMHLANDDSEPADEIKQDVPASDVVQPPVIEDKPAENGDSNVK
ncbi:phage holin [Lactobacillus helveticus]|uniref:phage holin n=1 Tax=Lactobacillus helveticus TaxID=1587 RepID=UPI001561E58C|nr:phage holin [Lactobacillus helveticus]NRN88443.1 hypothetical protein [Lactobacillus helveticus]